MTILVVRTLFTRIGRHLAILNTVTVILLITLVGVITFVAMRHSFIQEMDRALSERIETHQLPELEDLAGTTALSAPTADALVNQEAAEELVSSGDTLLYVFDENGQIIDNLRDVLLPGLPNDEGRKAALAGSTDVRWIDLPNGEPVRVMTVPLYDGGELIGAIQDVRSRSELHGAALFQT